MDSEKSIERLLVRVVEDAALRSARKDELATEFIERCVDYIADGLLTKTFVSDILCEMAAYVGRKPEQSRLSRIVNEFNIFAPLAFTGALAYVENRPAALVLAGTAVLGWLSSIHTAGHYRTKDQQILDLIRTDERERLYETSLLEDSLHAVRDDFRTKLNRYGILFTKDSTLVA
jgi:hypothetical protein